MTSPATSIRIQAICSELFWAARLNLLWIVFTLLGGVILGLGPATVAAYTLARRHVRGESIQGWAPFWAVYRREFVRGSVLVLPVAALVTLLLAEHAYFAASGALGPRIATDVALALLAAAGVYLVPLYAHYDLPPWACLPKASLLALTRPASTVLLLFGLSAIVYVTSAAPLLAPVISFGAWICLNTWLCLRFFEENEARLHSKGNNP
ncbi:YesL family protein [Nonomuraea rhizosphaerae]|uniref:YesL family protein n=1 Tax=Nonomuraea rhizosphaerae TaxID=2665663 RepID=UPI001FEC8CBB|nr:DUF624 domain-containing protein [Nonomuraea rhizosphaerae]